MVADLYKFQLIEMVIQIVLDSVRVDCISSFQELE